MILMYHKIDLECLSTWYVDVDNFYRQMTELRNRKVVYLSEYDPNNENHVVITFDGIYKNIFTYAFPILNKFNYPFELFVTSNYIGGDNKFDSTEPLSKFTTLKELSLMTENGKGRLQWHTHSHINLKSISHNQSLVLKELSIPEKIRKLDKKGFDWIAYPYGDFDERIIDLVKPHFKGAVSCNQGNNSEKFKLNRIAVLNNTSFKKNRISVIIPSYNYGIYLPEAIESVLSQTIAVDEIIIADDGSTDNTANVALKYIKKYPKLISLVKNKKRMGIIKNFNKAIKYSSGEYVVFLGADNRLRSDYIERTSVELDKNDKIAIVYSDFALFDTRAALVYKTFPKQWRGNIVENYFYVINFPSFNEGIKNLDKHNFIHGSSMFRKSAFIKVGGYKKSNGPEDHNLFKRIIKMGYSALGIKLPLLEYRQHSISQANIKFYANNNANNSINIPQNDLLQVEVNFLQTKIDKLESDLNKIQSAKFYRLWQFFCRIKNVIIK